MAITNEIVTYVYSKQTQPKDGQYTAELQKFNAQDKHLYESAIQEAERRLTQVLHHILSSEGIW